METQRLKRALQQTTELIRDLQHYDQHLITQMLLAATEVTKPTPVSVLKFTTHQTHVNGNLLSLAASRHTHISR